MEVNGKLVICSKCKDAIFLQRIGTKDLNGGYTQIDAYEELPDTWMYNNEIGYTCPACSKLFRDFILNTFGTKVAPYWQHPKSKKEQDAYSKNYVYVNNNLLRKEVIEE